MIEKPLLDEQSGVPLYRQLYLHIVQLIEKKRLAEGDRLPPTRELAGQLGLNRTTVSASYELLEANGWIKGHVGRGSFVAARGVDWESLLAPVSPGGAAVPEAEISFVNSRPSEELFPIEAFRATCAEVLKDAGVSGLLQLGSPAGYAPLRRRLLETARQTGVARESDDILITNGCQQALDLLERVFVRPGDTVAVEDPVYPGLKNVFVAGGAQVVGIPVGAAGVEPEAVAALLGGSQPKLLILTPSFQNPTGATLPMAARQQIAQHAARAGVPLVENNIYGALRYTGTGVPPLKKLDDSGNTIQLGSFSKVAFPGLRVGWILAPRVVIQRLTEAKQRADLHTDQLSQAVLLKFLESGRLEEHLVRMIAAGAERLKTTLEACGRWLPYGSKFTRPEGGMNLWVQLPEPLDAGELLAGAARAGVAYLPGRYFAVSRPHAGGLRLSFAGLRPEQIEDGVRILGRVFSEEADRARGLHGLDPAPAMV